MRRFKTSIWILLTLTVINFALAAPVGVREISEARDDAVDVAGDGTAASQKRWDPWDQSSKNAPDWKDVPPSPGWSDVENWLDEEPEPQNSGSSTGSVNGPSSLTPSKRPHPESTGDFPPPGSLIDDSSPRPSTKLSSDEYSPSWTKGPTDKPSQPISLTEGGTYKYYSPNSEPSTNWPPAEYSSPWAKGPTDGHSSSWTKWSSGEYSPSWGPTDEYSPLWSKEPTAENFPSWSKGLTDEYSPSWGSTDQYSPSWGSTDRYSPSWGSTDENSPSWTKESHSSSTKWSSDEYSPPISPLVTKGDSHPPDPGLTENHPLPALGNSGSSTGAHQPTNDHPPPPPPEPQHPAAHQPEDFLNSLLDGKFRIPS